MDDDPAAVREAVARTFEQSAEDLETAVRHLRTAARHVRDRDVPRGCAHAFAAYGHMLNGQARLDENAILHAAKSVP